MAVNWVLFNSSFVKRTGITKQIIDFVYGSPGQSLHMLLSGLIHEKCPFSKTVSSISKYMQRNCLTVNYFVGPLQVGLVMCSVCLIISVIQRYAKILLRKGIEEKIGFHLDIKSICLLYGLGLSVFW